MNVNKSYRTCEEWAVLHSYDTSHPKSSCHTYGWVVSRGPLSHVTHVNKSYRTCEEWAVLHTYEYVTCADWASRVRCLDMIRHTSRVHVTHMNDSSICVTWTLHMCDMTHPYVWHELLTCDVWRIHTCATRLMLHMCDMTYSHVWHELFTCATWLIHVCNMAQLYTSDMTDSRVWHDSLICVTWLCQTMHPCPSIREGQWEQRVAACIVWCSVLQRVAACCSVLQRGSGNTIHAATRCIILQHAAPPCNTHRSTLQQTLQHAAPPCNTHRSTLQQTLQHDAPMPSMREGQQEH